MTLTNCPNCAAPLKGGRCEYCGTQVEQPRLVFVEENAGLAKANAEVFKAVFCNTEDLSKYTDGLCGMFRGHIC